MTATLEEALRELLETLKTHKAIFYGNISTDRAREEIMKAMHVGNAALLALEPVQGNLHKLDASHGLGALLQILQGARTGWGEHSPIPDHDRARIDFSGRELREFIDAIGRQTSALASLSADGEGKALTVDEVEQIILDTEPSELSDRGDKIWTRRMAVALQLRLSAISPAPAPDMAAVVERLRTALAFGWDKASPVRNDTISEAIALLVSLSADKARLESEYAEALRLLEDIDARIDLPAPLVAQVTAIVFPARASLPQSKGNEG